MLTALPERYLGATDNRPLLYRHDDRGGMTAVALRAAVGTRW